MVEGNIITNTLPSMSAASIMSGIFWFITAILIGLILGLGIWWFFKKRKYNEYKVEIFDKDSNGNVYKEYDRAGIFLDNKTGFKLLFLERKKVGLNPNKIPYISHKDNKGRLIKTIYLRRIGVNNYVFIDMKLGEATKFTVGEEDLNNAHQEMVKIRRTYNKESWLQKYAPYLIFIITIMIIMIILISFFNKFTVLEKVSDNLIKVAESQEKAAAIMLNMTNSGILRNPSDPIIVPSGSVK